MVSRRRSSSGGRRRGPGRPPARRPPRVRRRPSRVATATVARTAHRTRARAIGGTRTSAVMRRSTPRPHTPDPSSPRCRVGRSTPLPGSSGCGNGRRAATRRGRTAAPAGRARSARPASVSRDSDDEQARVVVGAVAVIEARARAVGVFEQAACRSSARWSKRGASGRSCASGRGAGLRSVARRGSGRRRPTTRAWGRCSAARRPSPRGGRGRQDASGSPRPSPRVGVGHDDAGAASSSTAWGNAVAMTGRPAAMASTSTPEVTWSRESYGSTTTDATATSASSWGTSR